MSTINVAAIERELTSLWKQASEDEDNAGTTRASILNLLVYVPDTRVSTELDEMIADITAEHPCRAIVMVADRQSEKSYITAEVTSRCTIPTPDSKQVCCEQVTIMAGGAQVNEVPSAVSPLMLSDLPVYLWWRGVPQLTDKMFKRLVTLSDRVIIDSAEFANPYADLSSLASVITARPRPTALSDLNWARLTAWRSLLAGFYDVAGYRHFLYNLNRVRIEYSAPASDPSAIPPRALLLAGWLASRLGWQQESSAVTQSGGGFVIEMATPAGKLLIEFVQSRVAMIEPGHIAHVSLGSATDAAASFNIRRSDDRARIETEVVLGDERRIQRVLSYENWSESALIGRELEIAGPDRVYEQAVIAASAFITSR